MKFAEALIIGAVLSAGAAFAEEKRTDPNAIARGELMTTIGKNTGDDFRERKLTLPVIKAVAKADAEERAFWLRVIEKGDQREGDLQQALALMARHGAMEAARDQALDWSAKARTALKALPCAGRSLYWSPNCTSGRISLYWAINCAPSSARSGVVVTHGGQFVNQK